MSSESSDTSRVVYHSNPEHQQDRWVIGKVFAGKRGGFFVEAGAGGASNAQTLEQFFGWTGIAVEPHPELFKAVASERNCIVENVCLSDRPGEVSFTVHPHIPGTSMIEDMSERLKKTFYDPDEEYATITVEGVPLWVLLAKHDAPKVIDYLSLDIEGSEWLVLKDFPFDEYSFRCMTIERGADEYFRLRQLLLDNGYLLAKVGLADDYWVHPSVGYNAPVLDRIHAAARSAVERRPRLLGLARRIRNLLR